MAFERETVDVQQPLQDPPVSFPGVPKLQLTSRTEACSNALVGALVATHAALLHLTCGYYYYLHLHLFRSKPSRITKSKYKWTGQPGT